MLYYVSYIEYLFGESDFYVLLHRFFSADSNIGIRNGY